MSWATLSGFTGQTPNATKEARWPDGSLGTAHRWHHRLARLGEQVSGVLPALVGVEGDAGDIPTTDRDRHRQRGGRDVGVVAGVHGEPDYLLGVQVLHLGDAEVTFEQVRGLACCAGGSCPDACTWTGPLISGWA